MNSLRLRQDFGKKIRFRPISVSYTFFEFSPLSQFGTFITDQSLSLVFFIIVIIIIITLLCLQGV